MIRRVFTLLLCAFLLATLAAPIWAEGEESETSEETSEQPPEEMEEEGLEDPVEASVENSGGPSGGGEIIDISSIEGSLVTIVDLLGGLVTEGFDLSLLETIAGLVVGFLEDRAHFKVEDLRQPVDPEPEPDTMKWVVRSIFGEYHPVTTTSVYTETIGNDTYEYLLDTVAPGVAGVDFEWVAGVVLFAISLYSLFRLIGVILS